MPTNNQAVRFIGCSANSYANLGAYDPNTLYFVTDSQQLYLGDKEYTKSIRVLEAQPNSSTQGEDGRIYFYNGSLWMCEVTEYVYTWTRIANVNDYKGTVTQVTAGSGLTGGPITDSGVISHAVPSGASAKSDDLSDATPGFGDSFQIVGVTTDDFGHVTAVNLHQVTLPNETTLSVSATTDSEQLLNNEDSFEVVTSVTKGEGSHTLNLTKKSFKLPASIDVITYRIETGDQEGSVKIVGTNGSSTEAVVKDWDKLSKLTDITAVLKYKGKVSKQTDLPPTATVGDVYYVEEKSAEYVYLDKEGSGSGEWEDLGPIIDLGPYALSENVIPRVKNETGKVPIFTEDGTLTTSGHTLESDVPSNAKFTDTVYTHPEHTAHGLGLYKVKIDDLGHVEEATQVVKNDITELGIPGENTDTKVTTRPTDTQKLYITGTSSSNETTGELQIRSDVTIESDGSVKAKAFHGEADSAKKATNDDQDRKISDTYVTQTSADEKYATKDEVQTALLTWQIVE